MALTGGIRRWACDGSGAGGAKLGRSDFMWLWQGGRTTDTVRPIDGVDGDK